jgi:hypothetical protein
MSIPREDIDSALEEWINIGFSSESLNILKNRLYDKVVCEYWKKLEGAAVAEYGGFDSSNNKHIIRLEKKLLKKKKDEISSKYHEIRHCAIQEIFYALLDKESELYYGLDDENIEKRILDAYQISKLPLNTRSMRFQTKIRLVPKETRDKWKLIDEIDNYDGNKLEMITKNKNSLAEALDDILLFSNNSLIESVCESEQQAIKNNRHGKISLLTFLTTTPFYIYGLFTISTSPLIEQLYMYLGSFPVALSGFGYIAYFRPYGNVGIRERLKKNIENITDPYGQFSGFIKTK